MPPTTEELEIYLQNNILQDLENGRPDFDKPHTIGVVHWLKKIIENNKNLNLDKTVLLIAAYAHDWGYVGLFKKNQKLDYQDVKDAKSEHMKLGAEKLKNLLSSSFFSFLTEEQKKQAIHLVAVHDKLDSLRETDELVLMEADTLGALDTDFVTPTFDFASNDKYMQGVQNKRLPKFITSFGKLMANKLFEKRKQFFSTPNTPSSS